jgi:hypothetical protein
VSHSHQVELDLTGPTLKATIKKASATSTNDDSVSLAPIAEGASMSIDGSGGTFTVALNILSRNIKSNSFNIADT